MRLSGSIILGISLFSQAGLASKPLSDAIGVRMHGPTEVANAIIRAELMFERRSETVGAAIAMRDFMDATDGLSFGGGEPARGAAAIYAAHTGSEWAGKLSWVPTEVFASTGGDMGAVWGHFRYILPGKTTPISTGRYVTVWRKSATGAWKGIIDIGDPDPPPK